jgi:hypothetical protein
MKHTRLFVAPLAFGLFMVSGLAMAQPMAASSPAFIGQSTATPADKPAPTFEELDTKGRGYIQRGDVPKDVPQLSKLRSHFSEADLNHDGRLSKSEYETYLASADADSGSHTSH